MVLLVHVNHRLLLVLLLLLLVKLVLLLPLRLANQQRRSLEVTPAWKNSPNLCCNRGGLEERWQRLQQRLQAVHHPVWPLLLLLPLRHANPLRRAKRRSHVKTGCNPVRLPLRHVKMRQRRRRPSH